METLNREKANQVLDKIKEGIHYPSCYISECLRLTGDMHSCEELGVCQNRIDCVLKRESHLEGDEV
jgi:hypothetical protein